MQTQSTSGNMVSACYYFWPPNHPNYPTYPAYPLYPTYPVYPVTDNSGEVVEWEWEVDENNNLKCKKKIKKENKFCPECGKKLKKDK